MNVRLGWLVRALFLLLIFYPSIIFSQRVTPEFGDVSIKELAQKNSEGDTTSAIVLFEIGSLELDANSVSGTVFKRHMRLKILRTEGLQWGDWKFRIQSEGQLNVKGATYNLENGTIRRSELDQRSIMRKKFDREEEEISIAFPNVKVGSIVEFTAVIRHPDLYVFGWNFQYALPSRRSEYRVSLPLKGVVSNLRGSLKPTEHEVKNEGGYQRWVMTDIPAFVPEPQMPEENEFISSVEIANRHYNWDGVYAHLALHEQFSGIVHKYKFLKDIAVEVTTGMPDDRQKIKSISEYVKRQVKFNGKYDFYGTNPNELFDKKSGSAGDINLLLASMLEKAGFKVNMVLLSTRGNGSVDEKLPALRQFNYVICEVTTKEGELLVDATEELLPYDMLPPRCFNHKGFLMADKQYGWISVEPRYRNKVTVDAILTLSATGGLTGNVKSYKEGYAAYNARKKFIGGESNYKIDIGNSLMATSNPEVLNMKAIDKAVNENCNVSMADFAVVSNDLIYLNPYIFFREENNQFTANTRTYPVDFGSMKDYTVVCNITIPDGFKVEELPANKVFALPDASAKCTFSATQKGNTIMVMSKVQFSKTLYQPSEYASLKEFYAKLVAKKAENVVLKKM